ncbi:hypothetical protein BGZ99_004519 [Dissophora globulifera]|uniref:Uncharacterized protein n=1 Tax=Dissophora globulifera TaxID=979702 RepID=A0A9P6RHR7_9FUNG|nr:hypothetical protein BGZ99_004519 [Dissophora globulifera]
MNLSDIVPRLTATALNFTITAVDVHYYNSRRSPLQQSTFASQWSTCTATAVNAHYNSSQHSLPQQSTFTITAVNVLKLYCFESSNIGTPHFISPWTLAIIRDCEAFYILGVTISLWFTTPNMLHYLKLFTHLCDSGLLGYLVASMMWGILYYRLPESEPAQIYPFLDWDHGPIVIALYLGIVVVFFIVYFALFFFHRLRNRKLAHYNLIESGLESDEYGNRPNEKEEVDESDPFQTV